MVSNSSGEASAPREIILSTKAFHPGPSIRMAETRSNEWHPLQTFVRISLPGASGNCAHRHGARIRLQTMVGFIVTLCRFELIFPQKSAIVTMCEVPG